MKKTPPHGTPAVGWRRVLGGGSAHALADGEDLDHAHESVRHPGLLIRHEAQRDVGAGREIERQPARLAWTELIQPRLAEVEVGLLIGEVRRRRRVLW